MMKIFWFHQEWLLKAKINDIQYDDSKMYAYMFMINSAQVFSSVNWNGNVISEIIFSDRSKCDCLKQNFNFISYWEYEYSI